MGDLTRQECGSAAELYVQ